MRKAMKNSFIKSCVILFIICSSQAYSFDAIFYESLTYPDSDWSAQDFGSNPSRDEIELLKLNKPSTFIAQGQCLPMDFYSQYLKFLRLKSHKNKKLSRQWLKSHERDLGVDFILSRKINCISENSPPLYAYSWDENMHLSDGTKQKIKILKYSHTFFKSGLPNDLPMLSRFMSIGSKDIWHYLDIHGGIFYLVKDSEKEPFAMLIAQHNHFRSYIIGIDITREQSRNICYAIRSNEPYICEANQNWKRTSANYLDIDWVISGNKQPNFAGYDVVPGNNDGIKMQTRLEFLSSKDPLITSWIKLGPNLKVLGMFKSMYRDAPSGMAIYNTPKLKEVWKTTQYFYFSKDNKEIFNDHKENMKNFSDPILEPVFTHNAKRFTKYYYSAKKKY